MERYQMNRSGCRPYNNTCGMTKPQPPCSAGCSMPVEGTIFSHLQHLPVAMAYVPCQEMTSTFELCRALSEGTIFPELCKPFCGKRGGCR